MIDCAHRLYRYRALRLLASAGITLALAATAPRRVAAQITVGRNVQVSAARPNDIHSEVILAADPLHAERLLAGVHISWADTVGIKSIAYVSFDGGRTWDVSLERRDSTITADPAVAYGPDGSAYFATLARWGFYRSRNGGRTWDPPSRVPPAYAWDREYIVSDFTDGKYRGRVYMNSTVFPVWISPPADTTAGRGAGAGQREYGVGIFTSTDGGTTFNNPIMRLVVRPEGILGMANSVVLSDGTLVTLYGHSKGTQTGRGGAGVPLPAANYWLEVVTSTDGGETLTNAFRIGDYYMNRPRSEGAVIPHLAVDPGSALFKDRLYAVWSDFRTNRLEILLSWSSDKGKTWSDPITINDDRAAADPLKDGPDNITPTVAVNRDGVVAVSWYDRRDFTNDMGWNIRFRASLDGGETWQPSVKVTDKATAFGGNEVWVAAGNSRTAGNAARSGGRYVGLSARLSNAGFTFAPGHNGAFVADANGVFHPMWIDYRTGVAQVFTAPVTVNARVALNGGGDLAELHDLSGTVSLQLTKTSYDRRNNRLTFQARLKNTGKSDTIRGPLKARVLSFSSEVARTIEIANADNQLRGVGAVWDFTPLLPKGGLLPDSLTAARDLVFQLAELQPFRQGTELKLGFVNLVARILGPAAPARRAAVPGGED